MRFKNSFIMYCKDGPRFYIVDLFVTAGPFVKVRAHICELGRERDNDNIWRWVLPYHQPCKCSQIVKGGRNTKAPITPFIPTYVTRPLLSDDVDQIRRHFDLDLVCFGKYL